MVIKKSIKRKSSIKSSKIPKTKEAFKSHIFFPFKDLRNSTIQYAAHYISKGIAKQRFHVQIIQSGKTILFTQNKAWAKFRENATFDDILKGLRTYDIHDVMPFGTPDFMDYQKWTDRKFLRELSLHPEWLAYDETGTTTRLISLLKTARVANSDKARDARENLEQCLIPKRPGNLKYYPENVEEGLFLLKDLSKYISWKCMDFLRDGDIPNEYAELQEWGGKEEPRIVGMSPNDLSLLTYKPARFAEGKLSKELRVSIPALRSMLYK